jgi:Tfp pilus assembly protein PilN
MINLLPPQLKTQLAYAKRNTVVVRYIFLVAAVIVVIGAGFFGSQLYLDQRLQEVSTSIAGKEKIAAGNKDVEAASKTLNSRVAAIKAIQDAQPKFSAVLSDLARAVPKNASITGLTLTGLDSTPVKISADATSYQIAVSFRDALAASPRISGADIDSITGNATEGFHVDITIGFKPGQAK